jgi:hypothetical protein
VEACKGGRGIAPTIHNLHLPTTNLTLVQKGALYLGIKIYNHLPAHIKSLSKDPKNFKLKLKSFLLEQTLYILEEFYQVTSKEFYPICAI